LRDEATPGAPDWQLSTGKMYFKLQSFMAQFMLSPWSWETPDG
jgi:hypothetical protein